MWEKTLIESKGFGRATRARWTIPVAALLHAGLILIVILVSYWRVEAVQAPQQGLKYMNTIPVAIGPPPLLGQKHIPTRRAQTSSTSAPQNVQSTVISPRTNQNSEDSAADRNDETEPGSDFPVGVPSGQPWGEPFGINLADVGPGNGTADEPRKMSVNIIEPVLVRSVNPKYPLAAAIAHIEGIVIFEAIITRAGSVDQVKTLRADHPLLEKAARDAVLQWKYKPAMLQGQPVKVYFTVTVKFYLR